MGEHLENKVNEMQWMEVDFSESLNSFQYSHGSEVLKLNANIKY